MYQEHFGLVAPPFGPSPAPEYIYQSPVHQEALAHFQYAVENREALVLLTGEVGTGKTTAIQALRRRLSQGTPFAAVTHTTLEPKEFLEEIALRFGLNVDPGESKPSILRRLELYFQEHQRGGGQALLVIDEAHLLSHKVLEEVRLLSNLEGESGKMVQICLVGQPELERHLQEPALRQIRQRISVRYTLKPLSADDTIRYVHHRLVAAGAEDPERIFPAESCRAVFALTTGIPREINVVSGQALLNAFLGDSKVVTRAHVASVKEDYGFQGIVGGAASLAPESRVAQPPPQPSRASRRPGLGEGTARPMSQMNPPQPVKRPIPLPPASLRPPPREASEVSPAESAPGRPPEVEAAPVAAQAPAPAAPVDDRSPAKLSGWPGRSRRARSGGGGRWLALVMLLVAVAAAVFWWQNRLPLPAQEPSRTQTAPPPVVDDSGAEPAATPEEPVSSPVDPDAGPPVAAVEGEWVSIQVASFRTRSRAESILAGVESRTGLKGAVLVADVSGSRWYRILLGAFSSPEEARTAARPLLQDRTIREVVVRELPDNYVQALRKDS